MTYSVNGKGRWIEVIFDSESQTIHEEDIGEKWML